MMRFGFLLSLLLALAGCADTLIKQSIGVEPGMSMQQTTQILGPPKNRQFQGNAQAWQYCELGAVAGDFMVVWFVDGHVTGLSTWQDTTPTLDCSIMFKPVRWQDAPSMPGTLGSNSSRSTATG